MEIVDHRDQTHARFRDRILAAAPLDKNVRDVAWSFERQLALGVVHAKFAERALHAMRAAQMIDDAVPGCVFRNTGLEKLSVEHALRVRDPLRTGKPFGMIECQSRDCEKEQYA